MFRYLFSITFDLCNYVYDLCNMILSDKMPTCKTVNFRNMYKNCITIIVDIVIKNLYQYRKGKKKNIKSCFLKVTDLDFADG